MLVTYDPEDGSDKRTWTFDEGDVDRKEAQLIEKHYGEPWEMWIGTLRVRNAKARGVLLWHLLRQEHKGLRFEDTPNFKMRQLTVEMSSDELKSVWDQMSRTKMDEDMRDAFEAAYHRDLQDALAREGKAFEGEVTDEEPSFPKEIS